MKGMKDSICTMLAIGIHLTHRERSPQDEASVSHFKISSRFLIQTPNVFVLCVSVKQVSHVIPIDFGVSLPFVHASFKASAPPSTSLLHLYIRRAIG